MKNNKGQVLVFFILLIPLFVLILGVVINLGMTSIEKKDIDVSLKNILETSTKDLNTKTTEEIETEINKLITINLGDIEKEIIIDKTIKITITKKIDNLFPYLLKNKNLYYTVTMEGIIDNDKVKIIRR